MNRFSQKVIIVSRNLDDSSLANHGWFAKFAKLSHYKVYENSFPDEMLSTVHHTITQGSSTLILHSYILYLIQWL